MMSKSILIVDDEEFIRLNLKRIFSEDHYRIFLESRGRDALQTVRNEEIDLALLDLNLPDMSGLDILREMKKIKPDLLIIIVTGYASVESAVEALKLGAYDYIKKPFKADAIRLIARLALETQDLKSKVRQLKGKEAEIGLDSILGSSEQIRKVKHQIAEFSKYDSETVLITGESGSGKELVARALHNLSPRRNEEFIEINCASIPDTLLESELFGYEKGAFTDAKSRKIGLLEKAQNGTLFLDEIGEMSLALQAKLLRVIENKKFRRLGSTSDKEVNVRIIAATNKDFKEAISRKEFREDLYYRLNVLRIDVPPLRERGEDILIFARYFLELFNNKFNKSVKGFTPGAEELLLKYGWPGNVRELKNMVERICILQKDPEIKVHHLPAEIINSATNQKINICDDLFDTNQVSLEEILQQTERMLIARAYELSGGNVSKTARILKIPRETLRYKLEKYAITNGGN
ncbi:MAG TPA: sigma-54-dependent Fis family transcriptional regulator [Caldithrix abyssi]|uniref:Sigma-54-dependent Fis family transcriptional regulator n=1 Tax=Caldithrix abyssi TaxID=187145 RepID=A0A7V5PRV9_CALAY|nr:sigma-54-dependent Fis family transcriptional regulator [Caldithrix abyssi]